MEVYCYRSDAPKASDSPTLACREELVATIEWMLPSGILFPVLYYLVLLCPLSSSLWTVISLACGSLFIRPINWQRRSLYISYTELSDHPFKIYNKNEKWKKNWVNDDLSRGKILSETVATTLFEDLESCFLSWVVFVMLDEALSLAVLDDQGSTCS